jgi:hypothetical protein
VARNTRSAAMSPRDRETGRSGQRRSDGHLVVFSLGGIVLWTVLVAIPRGPAVARDHGTMLPELAPVHTRSTRLAPHSHDRSVSEELQTHQLTGKTKLSADPADPPESVILALWTAQGLVVAFAVDVVLLCWLSRREVRGRAEA